MSPPVIDHAVPDLDTKVRFLRSLPIPGTATEVEAIETHMSWVFMVGECVLKLKKPVRFPFLDFSTLAARAFYCREEVRLNQRLAPGVYLGLRAMQWHNDTLALLALEELPSPGQTVDWLVLMRRLPQQRMLHRLLADVKCEPTDIDALVVVLGAFYRNATTLPVPADEYAARFHREQTANREVLLRPQFALDHAAVALDRLDGALLRHVELLYERAARGRIVEGHGDLRPEHACLLEPPVVIDCIEFNALLRQVDPFDEVAFLGLECQLAGAPWIAARLVDGLASALGDHASPALIHLYTAQRALLRARLAMAHLLDPTPRTPQKWAPLAQRYVNRALAALDDLEGCGPLADKAVIARA